MVGSYNYEDIFNYDMEIDEEDLNRWDRTVRISSLGYYLVRDTRDNPVDSTRGFLNSMTLQFAADFLGPGSGANFIKFFTQHIHYRPVTESTVLAMALRLGLSRGLDDDISLPISERFFAGGGNTIRSLPLDMAGPLDDAGNPLGGNAMLLGNIELRQSIWGWLGGVAFIDVGNVFSEVQTMSLDDLRYCSGLGLRLETPIGPIRFDVGFNLNRREGEGKYEIFLSLGQTF
jgi:outer membrane protein assembly factor BamA